MVDVGIDRADELTACVCVCACVHVRLRERVSVHIYLSPTLPTSLSHPPILTLPPSHVPSSLSHPPILTVSPTQPHSPTSHPHSLTLPSSLSHLPSSLSHPPNSLSPTLPTGTNYTPNCDVYSFGVVLWEMITRRKPFIVGLRDKGIPVHSIMFKIAGGTQSRGSACVRGWP